PTRARLADHVWIWAVDPDFTPDADAEEAQQTKYRGYLRVRVQQLVNNFFEARRFNSEQVSMQDLWTAAQGSYVSTAVRHRLLGVREQDQPNIVSSLSEWSDGCSF